MGDEQLDSLAPEKGPRRRNPGARRRLVERDLDMLASLSAGRYLTVQALEWLHFPGWRERYQRYLEARETERDLVFRPAPHVYHRLGALREAAPALVHRITRAAEQGRLSFAPLPDAYVLAPAGAELLSSRREVELASLWSEDPRRRSLKNVEHTVAIGTFYAALRAALEHGGLTLDDWQGDHRLAARDPVRGGPSYDRVLVPGVKDALPVLPDGTFSLAGQRYFVEIDLGQTNLRSWGEKIRALERYRGSDALKERYGVEEFIVLIVVPDANRRRRVAEEVCKAVGKVTIRYRFLTADQVHPTTIRKEWQALQDFKWESRKVVHQQVELPVQLEWRRLSLWRNAPNGSAETPAEP
jgi:hypothetical protein